MEKPWDHGRDTIYMVRGKVMASWFEERSTRTRLSFESAMVRMGGSVISMADAGSTASSGKGETWSDSVKTLCQLSDIIVARTQHEGQAAAAAQVATKPFINAGDGSGEHPTQALLDVYTISKYFDLNHPISIALVGDLKYGRAIHSILRLLSLCPSVTYHTLSPDRLNLNPRDYLSRPDLKVCHHKSMTDIVDVKPDVIYMTRHQSERHSENKVGDTFIPKLHYLRLEHVTSLPETSIIMHPLPRGPELTPEIDSNPRAVYWRQVKHGLHVRMALIESMLNSPFKE